MTSPETPDEPSRPERPQYGEYAEPGDPRLAPPPEPVTAATPAPAVATTQPRRRDALVSALLLGLGFVMAVQVVFIGLDLDGMLRQAYTIYGGTGAYSPANDLRVAGSVLVASHVILFAATVLVTRSLVARRRLSFWVPLVGGALASVILFVTMGAVISSDPVLYETLNAFMTP